MPIDCDGAFNASNNHRFSKCNNITICVLGHWFDLAWNLWRRKTISSFILCDAMIPTNNILLFYFFRKVSGFRILQKCLCFEFGIFRFGSKGERGADARIAYAYGGFLSYKSGGRGINHM
jgi:hypothetical protein